MTLIGFYGTLSTAASIFVGILTAYLVTRLSDLKASRSRIRERYDEVVAKIESLETSREKRVESLEQTENQWEIEDAEDDVDSFINYAVDRDWSPAPDAVDVEDALEALVRYRDLEESDVVQHHYDELERRWDEIEEELEPDPFGLAAISNAVVPKGDNYYLIETLWDIYEREHYDSRGRRVTDTTHEIQMLEEQKDDLTTEYDSLSPEQLQESLKTTIVPILLSVILPLTIRFLHEIDFDVSELSSVAFVEPWAVFGLWLIGVFWTLLFVWKRIRDLDARSLDELPRRGESDENTDQGSELAEEDPEPEPA
jgi:hypothetical protein